MAANLPNAQYQYGTHSVEIASQIAGINRVFRPTPAGAAIATSLPVGQVYTYGTHAIAIHDQMRGISRVFSPQLLGPGEIYGVGRDFVIAEAEQPIPIPPFIVNNAALLPSATPGQAPLFGMVLSVRQEYPLAVPYSFVAYFPPFPVVPVTPTDYTCGIIDVYDYGNGTILIAWGPFLGTPPTSYNVYVNGVLNQTVTQRQATITGLKGASYVNQVLVPATTYDIAVHCVVGSLETSLALHRKVTAQPTSVMLTTPMKRIFPFPNSTMD